MVMLELAVTCGVRSFPSASAVFDAIMAQPTWILQGGLETRDDSGRRITPTCCCGLEDWRDWFHFLETGNSPFLGHNPTQWIERSEDVIRVWSAGLSEGAEYFIPFGVEEYRELLRQVENDLKDFLGRLREWAVQTDSQRAERFVARFDKMFEISTPGSKPVVYA